MKQVKVSELFDFLSKSKIKAGDGHESGEYPMYTSSENQTKYLDKYLYEPMCLVFGTGGKASVHLAISRFATSTDCITIRPKQGIEIDANYVFQYFKANMQVLENGFRGAGLKHISKKYLSDILIPHPELFDEQIQIATLLSRVEALITTRKDKFIELDKFLKSIFLEMFGPSNSDFENWPVTALKDLAAKHKGAMRTGPFGSNLLHSEFIESGEIAVLGIDNAVQNKFAWNERRFITKEKYEGLKNYQIFPDDVIITIMGTIGRSAVIPDDIPLAVNTKHLAAITFDKNIANPYFMSYSIHSSPYVINQFASKNRGAIMNGLNLGLIKETKINKPPIDLQNKFADILEKVETIKELYNKNLTELENLYGSLSQKAFKGELDVNNVPIDVVQTVVVETTIESLPISNTTFKPTFNDLPILDSKAQKKIIRQLADTFLSVKGDISTTSNELLHYINSNFSSPILKSDEILNIIGYDKVKTWMFKIQENEKTNQLNVSQYQSEKSGMVTGIAASIEVNLGSADMPMSDTKIRKKIIKQLFESYLLEKQDSTISFDQLWHYIDSNLVDLIQEPDEVLNSNDYDKVKGWLFEKLGSKKINQRFTTNRNQRKIVLDVTG